MSQLRQAKCELLLVMLPDPPTVKALALALLRACDPDPSQLHLRQAPACHTIAEGMTSRLPGSHNLNPSIIQAIIPAYARIATSLCRPI